MTRNPKALRRGIVAAIAVTSVIVLAACSGASGSSGGSGSSKAPYKLGFNDDLSSTIAFAGTTNLAGFQTYIDYINAKGGVNGHKIELKTLDNRSDAATSIANFKQLVSDFGAIGVFGNSASSATIATAPYAAQLKVPMLGFANADDFYTTFHPYLFKNALTQSQSVALQGQLISDTLFKGKEKGLKVAIAQTNTASGPPYTADVKALAKKKGWDVVTVQSVDVGATDCSAQAGLITASGAQVILGNLTSVGEDVVCMRALLSRGFTGKFVEQNSSVSEKTYQTLKSQQWISLRMYNWWSDSSNPGTKALQQQAKKYGTYSKLGDYSSDGYVAATLAVNALKKCSDNCTGTTFQKALQGLENVDTNGIAGPNLGFTTGDLGHTIPNGRFFIWNDEKQHSVPLSDWLCTPGRCK